VGFLTIPPNHCLKVVSYEVGVQVELVPMATSWDTEWLSGLHLNLSVSTV
jgi:hypothetical protein